MPLRGLIVKNCDVYAPEPLGVTDVTVLEGKVVSLERGAWRKLRGAACVEWEEIDGIGLTAAPGLVDLHCHFGGAGGEGGAVYRTPPLQLSDLTRAGITTAVGLLGTDGFCRSLRELLMKTRALCDEGISAWMWTGSYQIPGPALTGDVASDLLLIDKVIGLKVAMSDHRASQVSVQTLQDYAAQSRVGGIMAGKGGAVMVHIGEGENRLEQAIAYGRQGGRIDITSGVSEKCFFPGAVKPSRAVARALDAGVPLGNVTMSSDGNGVMTRLLENGEKQPLMAPVGSLAEEFFDMIREGLGVETAVRVCSTNPAAAVGLSGKGRLAEGGDADLILFPRDLTLAKVIAKGRVLVDGDKFVKGMFER